MNKTAQQEAEVMSIPLPPPVDSNRSSAGTKQGKQIEPKFSDPIGQMAWEAYKEIEPYYSEANRKLANE